MCDFYRYVRHLYWKYEDEMDGWERDCVWHGCVGEIEHLMTDAEKEECARLWEQDYEYGYVD